MSSGRFDASAPRVVSRRRSGFGDCLVSLVSAWGFARATGRHLVCDWRRSTYLADPHKNAFGAFFIPPDAINGVPFLGDDRVAALKTRGAPHPPWWWRQPRRRADAVARIKSGDDVAQQTLVFTDCLPVLPARDEVRAFLTAIALRPRLADAVAAFAAAHFGARPVVGVHLRHGNGGDILAHAKYWEAQQAALAACVAGIHEALGRTRGGDAVVFLATDSQLAEDAVRAAFPGVVTRAKFFRAPGRGELHKGARYSPTNGADDALIEMALLARADVLVRYPPDSYFSWYAAQLVDTIVTPPRPGAVQPSESAP